MGGPSTSTGTPKLSTWFRIFITCRSTAHQTTSWTLGSIHRIWNIEQVQGINLTARLSVTFYKVLNSMGQQVFFAAEKNDCCTRQCCGPLREFEMALTGKRVVFMMNSPPWNIVNVLLFILDNNGREVARFNRPFKMTCRCCTCYCPCCLQEMEITASGTTVGYILQKQDFCNPVFQICDSDKKVVLEIKGPVCAISCCGDINFEVLFSCYEYDFLNRLPRY